MTTPARCDATTAQHLAARTSPDARAPSPSPEDLHARVSSIIRSGDTTRGRRRSGFLTITPAWMSIPFRGGCWRGSSMRCGDCWACPEEFVVAEAAAEYGAIGVADSGFCGARN